MRKIVRIGIVLVGVCVVGGGLLYHFGKPLWEPLSLKMRGRHTLSDRIRQIEPAVLARLESRIAAARLVLPLDRLTYIGLKDEQVLEVWGTNDTTWHLLATYPFTAFSGTLGPKLREGDRQIPEGIYAVESLNPNSHYYLSIKVSYPNPFDREMAARDGRTRLGGDIFLHGKAVTIGCIPVGDTGIEDLFYLAAQTGITNVTVIIAPYDMRSQRKDLQIPHIEWEGMLYHTLAATLMDYR